MENDRKDLSSLVSLDEHRLARRDPALVQVEAYWEALRGARIVPERAEVDPRGLTGALEHAFVLERIAPGLARFRVAGMHLSDLMGLEVRGMPISAIFLPEARPELARALDAAFDEPARVRLLLKGDDGFGRPPLLGELVLLPLRAGGGEINRVLGAIAMDGRIGRQPRRLTITSVEHKTLTGYADGRTAEAPAPAPQRPVGFGAGAPTSAKSAPSTSVRARAPFLKLVHSADE